MMQKVWGQHALPPFNIPKHPNIKGTSSSSKEKMLERARGEREKKKKLILLPAVGHRVSLLYLVENIRCTNEMYTSMI